MEWVVVANAVVASVEVLVEESGVGEVALRMLACALSKQSPAVRQVAALCLVLSADAMLLMPQTMLPKHTNTLLLSLYLASTGWVSVANVAVVSVEEVLVVAGVREDVALLAALGLPLLRVAAVINVAGGGADMLVASMTVAGCICRERRCIMNGSSHSMSPSAT